MRISSFFALSLLFLQIPAFSQSEIKDADGNTKVQTEALPNENQIRIVTNGLDRLYIGTNAAGFTRMDIWNSNQCVFLGQGAGFNATAGGSNNVGVGFRAGEKITSGFANTFIGQEAGGSTNTGALNVAIGSAALISNTSGNSNIAIGGASLNQLVNGSANVAIGDIALSQNTASENTAVGTSALAFNTTGTGNTALGRSAGRGNTVGSGNTALGFESLRDNSTGSNNAAVGILALSKNTSGGFNVAVGTGAAQNNTLGSNNTSTGANSLFSNTSGNGNTALGRAALFANTTGTGNTAAGLNAGDGSTGNTNCTYLGNDADNTLAGSNFSNSTALGNGSRLTASNQIRIGNSAVTSIGGFVNFTNISDGRIKRNVRENVPGLDFILQLRPVTYHLDIQQINQILNTPDADDKAVQAKEKITYTGFIAQEVEAAAIQADYEFSGVDAPQNDQDLYGLRYAEFVAPLVKAIQEQQAQIDALQQMVAALLASQSVNNDAPQMLVWPNPTGETLQIALPEIPAGATIALYMADGKLAHTAPARSGAQVIDLKMLPAGNYFLQLQIPGQKPQTKTIVKNR